ncbi:dTDP-4-dehydrorhamnose reductase [Paenibacillus sp. Y412MC10]|uniref:dTDP-4-dehydrorhamnose reductase n=1 Tax=Geobacillus sp. (strain Y412MC10) TaxID=481743 RepID=UPI00017891E5|nr:dTDP-4-dehydrorhamnose reductase [Paenibacillus sp. Y412MC10]ACX68010.1 dTDP-4-dehydrorhamnose reductase [Paenibacillus sp. Y412MC10]
MKVLVTGAQGQLGKDVVSIFKGSKHDVLGCGRNELDINNLEQCHKIIKEYQPDCIIHCAAYTAVDAAESDSDQAYQINAIGTRNLAIAAESVGSKLIYISSDYVFNGRSDYPYVEYDRTDPQSVYGKSKLAGEILTQTLCSKWFIVRTSWAFGLNGNNFVKTMLRLGQERTSLQVVNDQKGSPTFTIDLASFLLELADTEKYGVYHASNQGECTWYEFTQAIFQEARKELGLPIKAELSPCTTDQFPRAAPRPANSVLEHMSIRTNGFADLPHWQDALKRFIAKMKDDPKLY